MIRISNIKDFDDIVSLENHCFKESERINFDGLYKRLLNHSSHSYVLVNDDKVCAYLTYVLSDKLELDDEMFGDNPQDYNDGKYIIILGLACDPLYKNQGYASKLMYYLLDNTNKDILLTCHDYLIPFYEKFNFKLKGISNSSYSTETWYDMIYYAK